MKLFKVIYYTIAYGINSFVSHNKTIFMSFKKWYQPITTLNSIVPYGILCHCGNCSIDTSNEQV